MITGCREAATTVNFGLRISIEEVERLRRIAKEEDRPISTVARRLLVAAIEQAEAVPA